MAAAKLSGWASGSSERRLEVPRIARRTPRIQGASDAHHARAPRPRARKSLAIDLSCRPAIRHACESAQSRADDLFWRAARAGNRSHGRPLPTAEDEIR